MASEAQREASARYIKKIKAQGLVKDWKIRFRTEEAEEFDKVLKEYNLSKPDLIRKAIKKLKNGEL